MAFYTLGRSAIACAKPIRGAFPALARTILKLKPKPYRQEGRVAFLALIAIRAGARQAAARYRGMGNAAQGSALSARESFGMRTQG